MAIAASAKPEAKTAATGAEAGSLVVLDIGKKQRKKRIRQLRKGRGKLFDRVRDLLEGMKEEGTIDKGAQPIVIVVREKGNSPFKFRLK